mgnify:FL=1
MSVLKPFNKNLIQLDSIFHKFNDELVTFFDLKKKNRIIIAVSGGMDSMALFSLLYSKENFDLIIAHVNHHFRGDSDKDESLVQSVCRSLDIPFFSKSLNPEKIKKGESVEEWGRTNRYHFFNEVMEKTNANWIMTAHHGNDQMETVLMNLSRKSGILGLCGIGKETKNILRPLLSFTKKELTGYVTRNEIPFREDSTNHNLSNPRNFIRHTVVKPWENNVQNLVDGVQSSIKHFSEWKNALDYFILDILVSKIQQSDNRFDIPIKMIQSLPDMVKIRLVQLLMEETYNEPWSKHQIELLKSFFKKEEVGNLHILPNGWKLLRDRESIIGKETANQSTKYPVNLVPGHPVDFNDYRYELVLSNQWKSEINQNQEKVDWTLLKDHKLEIRAWAEGDFFQPLGMEGHQKISDFLVNEKVDQFTKESQAVLTANDQIIWVCGKRIADWVKLTPHTQETAILNRISISL